MRKLKLGRAQQRKDLCFRYQVGTLGRGQGESSEAHALRLNEAIGRLYVHVCSYDGEELLLLMSLLEELPLMHILE